MPRSFKPAFKPLSRASVLRRLLQFIAFVEAQFAGAPDVRAALSDALLAIYEHVRDAYKSAVKTQPLARAWLIVTHADHSSLAALHSAAREERAIVARAARSAAHGG